MLCLQRKPRLAEGDSNVSRTSTLAAEPATETKPAAEAPQARRTQTDWSVFEQAGLWPLRIRHDNWSGDQPAELVCHTNLQLTAESVLAHCRPEHGLPFFRIRLGISDSKVSPLWKALQDAGLEIKQIVCPHCGETLPLRARSLRQHLVNHPGRVRINLDPQVLCFEFADSLDNFEESGEFDDSVA
jgi:hypothetical protein